MSAATPALAAHDLSLSYGGSVPVLANFGLTLGSGEIVSVLGPSGVGKSSLIRVLAGLERPSIGKVEVSGKTVSDVHPAVAITFQNPGLLPWLSLERNVAFGLNFKSQPPLTPAERRTRTEAAIQRVSLQHARHLFPRQLSGGMAQRTALARSLARRPAVLLLDEPFGALDEVTRADMQRLLLSIVDEYRTSVVLVTHDIDEALLLSDRVILLGGSPAREFAQWHIDLPHPRDDRVAELGQIRIEIVQALRGAIVRQQ